MENIIIDTDLGYDCDDGGALIIANKLHKQGRIRVAVMTHCVNSNEGAFAIKKINEYYGNSDIPIGVSDYYAFDVNLLYEEFFCKLKYRDDFAGFKEKPSFYKLLRGCFSQEVSSKEKFVCSSDLILEDLEQAEDNSITLVCIGQLNTLAALIKKNHSLLKKKIKKAVVMCGNFAQTGDYFDDGETLWNGEFNVIMDIKSAQTVINESDIRIDFIDYNQGIDILTGDGLFNQTDNPVSKMYNIHGKGKECASWDPITVLYASGEYDYIFQATSMGKAFVNEHGKTTFSVGNGKHRLISIIPEKKNELRNLINDFFGNK